MDFANCVESSSVKSLETPFVPATMALVEQVERAAVEPWQRRLAEERAVVGRLRRRLCLRDPQRGRQRHQRVVGQRRRVVGHLIALEAGERALEV